MMQPDADRTAEFQRRVAEAEQRRTGWWKRRRPQNESEKTMRFNPVTEEEAKKSARGFLLEPGECEFEVRDATDETSNSGNPMIKLTMDVFDKTGKKAIVYDYLLEAMAHKVRHFAYAVGLGHFYEAGEFDAEHCVGKGGRLIIRTKKQQGYEPKNDVADYVVGGNAKTTPGYQNAKAQDSGNAAPPLGGRDLARRSFNARASQLDPTARSTAWMEAVSQYFGHTDQGSIPDGDWRNFEAVVRQSWQAGKGIPIAMRKRVPVEAPFGESQEFKEDDIPF
jgi:hypothetical protein